MKTAQKERMYQQIEKHGENLNRIFQTTYDNITLCKKLHRLEVKAHRLAEDYCNGVIDCDQWDIETANILASVNRIIGHAPYRIPVFVNGDARGYALKIDDEYMRANDIELYRDFGGYGILAPEFDGN